MAFDERPLESLIEQSHDAHSDAMRHQREVLCDLADVREAIAGARRSTPARRRGSPASGRSLADDLGLADGGWARKGVLAGGTRCGARRAAHGAGGRGHEARHPDPADRDVTGDPRGVDVPHRVDPAVLLGIEPRDHPVLSRDDAAARRAPSGVPGADGSARRQGPEAPEPEVRGCRSTSASPILTAPVQVTKLAAILEQVATDTYLAALPLLTDTRTKALMASVMGVEAQHLAILRAVTALFDAGASDLIMIPADAAQLPATAGSVGVPRRVRGHDDREPAVRGARCCEHRAGGRSDGAQPSTAGLHRRQFLLAGGAAALAVDRARLRRATGCQCRRRDLRRAEAVPQPGPEDGGAWPRASRSWRSARTRPRSTRRRPARSARSRLRARPT